MSSSNATPTVDELRERGTWSPALDKFVEWDPDWTERCARLANNPWTTGILPVKWIELICIALNAASTHRNESGVRRHVLAALQAGATRDEILGTLKGVSVLGIHSVAVGLPILLEEAARRRRAADTSSGRHRPYPGHRPAEGRRPVQPGLGGDLPAGSSMAGGVPGHGRRSVRRGPARQLVELMAIAVDASCTHLYTPGIRRHMESALSHGVAVAEIMEVLKLCGALGVDACELGAPILFDALALQEP